jgi:hypothetical protein
MTTPLTPIEQLRRFVERIDPDAPRLVVRWADESRITPEEDASSSAGMGFRVKPVAYATLTARHNGEPVQTTIEGLRIKEIKEELAHDRLEVLYRSDNITR